jgi:lipopolysaccharide biosynthesis glycosyltransferase
MTKVAIYSGSRNIYNDMVVSAKSLIENSDVNTIWFLIEDDEFPYGIPKDIIKTRNVSDQKYFDSWGPNMTSDFTYFAMMRAALALEFPEYDRVLSLDADTICVRDVSHVWELPIEDLYFSASSEAHRCVGGLMYTNAGVMLQNLKKLRDTGKSAECIDILNRQKFTWVDQDVMNYACQGYIYDMNSEFNANNWTSPCHNPRIIHFAGIKQDRWHRHPKYKEYSQKSWNEIFLKRNHNMRYPR